MEFVGKKRIAAQCLAIAIQVFSADRADASLQDQIDTVFDSMVNTTTPGTYETQMRGVLAGGSLQMRNRIVNRNAVGFVPPSMGAGCGGIDLYGGSLSFINLDQFVGLLRGIASNSTGLAFQVAINAIDPLIGQTLENLQKKVQRLNEYMGSSCQLAQGVITDTLGAITEKAQFNEGLIAMTEGAAGDLFSGWGDEDGTDAPTQAMSANAARVAQEVTGNLVWRNLKKQDVSSWFVSGGDDALLEAIMSVTGTVIVGELEAAADGEGDSHRITRLPPGSIELDDLLVGGEVEVYRCDDRDVNACLNPTPTIMEIEGLVAKFQKTLTSATDDPGLVTQLRLNLEPTDEQMRFLTGAPGGLGVFVRNLSVRSEHAAILLLRSALPAVALESAHKLMLESIRAAETAASLDDNPYATEAREMLAESRRDLNQQYLAALDRYGNLREIVAHYREFMLAVPERRLYRTTSRTTSN